MKNQTAAIIRAYKENYFSELDKIRDMPAPENVETQARLALVLEFDGWDDDIWNIRFKIGNRKTYFVKDIERFLKQMALGEVVAYGKAFTFAHRPEHLDTYSAKLYHQMLKWQHLNEDEDDGYYHSYRYASTTKRFELGGRLLDEFFEFIHVAEHQRYLEKNFRTSIWEEKPQIIFTQIQKSYQLQLILPQMFYSVQAGEDFCYAYDKGVIYRLFPTLGNKTTHFIDLFTYGDLSVPVDEFGDFFRYVLASVKDVFEFVDLPPVEQKLEQSTQVFIDIDDLDRLVFTATHTYDDGTVREGFGLDTPNLSLTALKICNYIRHMAESIEQDERAYLALDEPRAQGLIASHFAQLRELCPDVHVSNVLKNMNRTKSLNMQVGITVKGNLLAIDLSSVDIAKDEMMDVLAAYRRKKRFYKLKNGERIQLADDTLAQVSELLTTTDAQQLGDAQFEVELNRAFSLYEMSEQDNNLITFERSDLFAELIGKITDTAQQDIVVPDKYDSVLRDYQKAGHKWLKRLSHYGFGGVLADDMGLGKTLQVISVLEETPTGVPNLVICPASLLLNWKSEIEKFSGELSAVCVMGTAKERQNLLADYTAYNVIFLMPGYLYSYAYFQRQFESPIMRDPEDAGIEATQHLKRMISPFILRRTKKEVLTELPDKIENTQLIEFNAEENKLYLAHLAQVNQELAEALSLDGAGSARIQILAMLTRLRQLCCEPRVLFENINTPSSKLSACIELIRRLQEHGKKVLIFSSFTSVLELIETELFKEQISYHKLTGSTSKDKRHDMVQAFQTDDTPVFLISLKAGGTGLNLTAAEAVIHFDPWWNISAQNQATDRAHRIG